MNESSILETIIKHKDELRLLGIRRIGLFGSQVHGTATDTSDIDLLVEFDPAKKTYRNFFAGTVTLESILHRPVDVVTPQALSPYIKPHIERDIRYVQISD